MEKPAFNQKRYIGNISGSLKKLSASAIQPVLSTMLGYVNRIRQ